MAFTVSNALRETLLRLGQLNVSKATGGSTTTIVDSTLANENSSDDDWNDGWALVVRDAGGAAGAPENEFQRISDFVASTGTFTVDTAFTVAPASGDVYGYASSQFALQTMIRLLNTALVELGDVPLMDTTTLDTAANQTEYTAAVAWKRRKPYRIDIQGRTGDSNDNQWHAVWDWEWIPAAAGSTGLIVFKGQPLSSRDIRVWYQDAHPAVNAYSDAINERFEPDLVVKAFVLAIRGWQVERDDGSDASLQQKWNKAKSEYEAAIASRKPERPKRRPRLMIPGLHEQEEPLDDQPMAPAAP